MATFAKELHLPRTYVVSTRLQAYRFPSQRRAPLRRSAFQDTSSAVGSNLGQLGRFTVTSQLSEEDAAVMFQRVDPASFNDQGLYVNGASIFASSLLLLVLLAFSTNRIFGLDRFVVTAARAWREEQRKEEVQKLQRMMGEGSNGTGEAGGDKPRQDGPDP